MKQAHKPLRRGQGERLTTPLAAAPLEKTDISATIIKINKALEKAKKKKRKKMEYWTCANRPIFGGMGCGCTNRYKLTYRRTTKEKRKTMESPVRCNFWGKPL